MKRLAIGISLTAAILATSWFVWALVTDRAVASWFAEQEAAGLEVETSGISVSGFPTEFITEITAIAMTDPDSGWTWTGDRVAFRQSALDLSHVTATWPRAQAFSGPGEQFVITADRFGSIMDVQTFSHLRLDGSETRIEGLTLTDGRGEAITLTSATTSILRNLESDATYDVEINAFEVSLPQQITDILAPGGELPPTLSTVQAAAEIQFDRPWDITAFEDSRPQPVAVRLHDVSVSWGTIDFSASGTLEVDGAGRATGTLDIRAQNWAGMLDVATRSGLLPQGMAGTARTGLGLLAGLSGAPEDIDATLRLDDGFVFLGPLPIGQAPPFLLP